MSTPKSRPKLGSNRGVPPDLSIVRPNAVASSAIEDAVAGPTGGPTLSSGSAQEAPVFADEPDTSLDTQSRWDAVIEPPQAESRAPSPPRSPSHDVEERSEDEQGIIAATRLETLRAAGEGRQADVDRLETNVPRVETARRTKTKPVAEPARTQPMASGRSPVNASNSRIHGTFTEPRFRKGDGVDTRQTTVTHPLSLDERIDDLMRHNRGRWRTKSRAWCEAMELFLEKYGE